MAEMHIALIATHTLFLVSAGLLLLEVLRIRGPIQAFVARLRRERGKR